MSLAPPRLRLVSALGFFAAILLTEVATCPSAHAADRPLADLRVLSADPNVAAFGLYFRGAMRASVGAELPFVASDRGEGFGVAVTPYVELHEPPDSDQLLPSQFWRARLSIEASHRWRSGRHGFRVAGAVEHESDHETAHEFARPGFLALNDIAARARWTLDLGSLRFDAGAEAALYAFSCTELAADCREFEGATTAGGALDVVMSGPPLPIVILRPFGSVALSGILSHDEVRGERRVVLRAGLFHPLGAGVFSLYILGFFGNDVGRTRGQDLSQFGFGASWAADLWPP